MPEGVLLVDSDYSEYLLYGPEDVIFLLPEGVSLLSVPNGVRVVVPEGVSMLIVAQRRRLSSV